MTAGLGQSRNNDRRLVEPSLGFRRRTGRHAQLASLSGFFKPLPYKLASREPAALEFDAVQDDILVGEFLVTDQHCSPRGNTPSLQPDESVGLIS